MSKQDPYGPVYFAKVDPESGAILQTGSHDDPSRKAEDVWEELKGLIEQEGNIAIRVESEAKLPNPLGRWDGKDFVDPPESEPADPAIEAELEELREKAKRVRDGKGKVTFTSEERDRIDAMRLLGEL